MHVPSNQCSRQSRRRRRSAAVALMALLGSLAGGAQAVEFDEKLKAPMVRNGAELKPKLDSHVQLMNRINAKAPIDQVRDKASLRQRVDLYWLLGRLVDERVPLPELSALGFEAKGDGSYRIDTHKHPQWRPLDQNLTMFGEVSAVDAVAPALTARGMRDDDLAALRAYIAANDLEHRRAERKLSIVLSAAKVAKKYQKAKQPFDDRAMLAYFYQKQLGAAEVEQQWSEGLMNSVSSQAQRILASFFAEDSGSWFIAPTPTADALEYERQMLLKPDIEQLARKAFEEGKL
jgi:hypothetical protein